MDQSHQDSPRFSDLAFYLRKVPLNTFVTQIVQQPKMKTDLKSLSKLLLALPALICLNGCISIKTHSSFEPIYMTLDVNLKVQLQQELSDVFGDIDAASTSLSF